jgi:hypothetical protein
LVRLQQLVRVPSLATHMAVAGGAAVGLAAQLCTTSLC